MIVVWLFLTMPQVCLKFVIVVFPDYYYCLQGCCNVGLITKKEDFVAGFQQRCRSASASTESDQLPFYNILSPIHRD